MLWKQSDCHGDIKPARYEVYRFQATTELTIQKLVVLRGGLYVVRILAEIQRYQGAVVLLGLGGSPFKTMFTRTS